MKKRVVLFCGGRGSATQIREWIRKPEISLDLIINAYDDGLSTGQIRDFVPGMLGPSDFRKNLSYLLDLYSEERFSLTQFLEYRITEPDAAIISKTPEVLLDRGGIANISPSLEQIIKAIHPKTFARLNFYLTCFLQFASKKPESNFNYVDCSLGNLLFAGAYIHHDFSFNRATQSLAEIFDSKARLINVTKGDNRVLVALKSTGEFLERESKIVSKQSRDPIQSLFLLEHYLSEHELSELNRLDFDSKQSFLSKKNSPVEISPEAQESIENADLIIFGSGTQHSSLFPSYMTEGFKDALIKSRAKAKVLMVNLAEDQDILGLSAVELINRALQYMGDPNNSAGVITHALIDSKCSLSTEGLGGVFKGIEVCTESIGSIFKPEVHNGAKTVAALEEILRRSSGEGESLYAYVNLNERSVALPYLFQEIVESEWLLPFREVHFSVAAPKLPPVPRSQFDIRHTGMTEIEAFRDWIENSNTEYFAMLSGDGEYRLSDINAALSLLRASDFAAIYGSRTQSRRKLKDSLFSAYTDSKVLYRLSLLSGFLISLIYFIRNRVIFTDPLTGFRVIRRSRLPRAFLESASQLETLTRMTLFLLKVGGEIGEIPVSYRTFRGFTNIRWRTQRGLKSLVDAVF